MTDDDTQKNWRTRWAEGQAWAKAHPKIARAVLLAVLLLAAFALGRCSA